MFDWPWHKFTTYTRYLEKPVNFDLILKPYLARFVRILVLIVRTQIQNSAWFCLDLWTFFLTFIPN